MQLDHLNLSEILNFILNLDEFLVSFTQYLGPWSYLILFLIIFSETGLVIFPFLPGDSLLFTVGVVCSIAHSSIDFFIITPLLILAVIMGDSTNYFVGKKFSHYLLKRKKLFFINHKHIEKTQQFYAKYGGKTVFLGRFIPIVRTFAPFVAGIGKMNYRNFLFFSISGSFVWICSLTSLGYFFGNLPFVKGNFHFVIIIITFISVLPILIEYFKKTKFDNSAK